MLSKRRSMEAEDGLSAGFNVVFGLLLGLAINGPLQLVVTGFWLFAAIVLIITLGFILAHLPFDRLIVQPLRNVQMLVRP